MSVAALARSPKRVVKRGAKQLVGVDASAAYLEAAASRVTRGDVDVAFQVGDAQMLPFPDASFDAAVSGLVLNFVSDPARAVREMQRWSGPVEAGAEIIEAAVLLLSHLAWGNMVAVAAPFKMQFYRFASSGAPLTGMAGATIGSAPGLMVLFLLHSESPFAAMAIAVILLLVIAAYLVSLHYAGRSFEHRTHIIGDRLS